MKIVFIDRRTQKKHEEKVYHENTLAFLYKKGFLNKSFVSLIAKLNFISAFYGWLQRLPSSKKKIIPFIEKYGVNSSEFEQSVDTFTSFNDFFCRRLKKEARPIEQADAIIPADGRFLFYSKIDSCDGFVVKGKKFSLETLLKNKSLTTKYQKGSMIIGRLCPSDYHRFHFPANCTPTKAQLINGPLFSVNPIAVQQNIDILCENKRMITELKNTIFGTILFIEIGATCVGSIHQTYKPESQYKKGDEKGFFSFGGSSIILLFEENQLEFDSDLLHASEQHIETLCLMGQSLGNKKNV